MPINQEMINDTMQGLNETEDQRIERMHDLAASDSERDVFRDNVLAVLDRCADKVFGTGHGWNDGDLPELFKVLDAHYEKLRQREIAKWKD